MFNFFKRKRNKKGFTLVEVLTVILVIAVLAAVAIPSYTRAVEKSRATEGMATLQQIAKAQTTYNALKGSYSSSFSGLPLDLRDFEKKHVVGSEFSSQFFDFTMENNGALGVAERNNGEYTFTADFTTGKFYCTPEDNPICVRFGLEGFNREELMQELINTKGGGNLDCTQNEDTCYLMINGRDVFKCVSNATHDGCMTDGMVCHGSYCHEFKDGIEISSCFANKEGTGCLEGDAFICDKYWCHDIKDGKEISSCRSNAEGTDCIKDGILCEGENCYEFKDGQQVSWCPSNLEGDGCLAKDEIVCKEDKTYCYRGDGYYCHSNEDKTGCFTDGKYCEGSTCYEYKDGKEISSCRANDEKTGCVADGIICENGWCSEFKDGQNVKSCPANEEGTGCLIDGTVCNGEQCDIYEDGKQVGNCPVNADYTGCADSKVVCHKELGICYIYDENGKVYDRCTANEEATDCKNRITNGLVCADGKCILYEDGKDVGSCEPNKEGTGCKDIINGVVCNSNGDCYEYKDGIRMHNSYCPANAEGTGCVKDDFICRPAHGQCYTYENGQEVGKCKINKTGDGCVKVETICNDGKCNTYEDGDPVSECEANYAGTACKPYCKEDGLCYDNNGNKCWADASGKDCAQNGLICYSDGQCREFKDGKEMSSCYANSDRTGCISDGLVCDGWKCQEFKDGKPSDWCYDNGNGECIKGEGREVVCHGNGKCEVYENGKDIGSCEANDDGTGCKEESSSGGNSMKCGEYTGCHIYDANGKEIGQCNQLPSSLDPARDCYTEFGLSGRSCDDAMDVCYNFENGKETFTCHMSTMECYNKITGEKCKSNSSWTGCAEDSGSTTQAGLVCKEDSCSYYDANGNLQYCPANAGSPDFSCYVVSGLSGIACDEVRCVNFVNGEEALICDKYDKICHSPKYPISECEANATLTGCKDSKNGLYCDGPYCVEFKNGLPVNQCYNNGYGKCIKGYGTEIICSDGVCNKYEDGVSVSNCIANAEGTGCKNGVANGLICDGWACYESDKDGFPIYSNMCYDNGNGECIKGTGTEILCYSDGFCRTFEDGELTGSCAGSNGQCIKGEGTEYVCHEGKCEIYKNGFWENSCEANAEGTGCADSGSTTQTGLVCNADGCIYYDEDGKLLGSCPDLLECYHSFGLTGTSCGNDICGTFENGQRISHCNIKDKKCYDKYYEECTPNENWTGCSESGGSSSYTCEGWKCKDSNGNECYYNGKDGCISGAGQETVCIDGQCISYKDGKEIICSGVTCTNPDGSTCFNNGFNGCITGQGWEMGTCNGTECYVYENGTQHKCNKDQWSVGGCNLNSFICEGAVCSKYKYGMPTGETCYNDGWGNCIEGKGDEFVCVLDQCNLYLDGKLMGSCVANTTFTGCRKEGEPSGCSHSVVQTTGGVYVEYENGEATGITFKLSEDGKCMSYKNGELQGQDSTGNCQGAGSCIKYSN